MKLLKRKNFQSLIYAIFISLPFLSILPSTIYFAFNHEASNYTHVDVVESYEYETNEVNSVDDLVVGNIYKLDLDPFNTENVQVQNEIINAYYLRDTSIPLTIDMQEYDLSIIIQYSSANLDEISNYQVFFYERELFVFDDTYHYIYFIFAGFGDHYLNHYVIDLISASDYLGEKNVEVIESEMNPQNAFEYTISKFIKDNNFGRIDFFSFFSSLFLGNATINGVYVGFVNWYLNYILYISLAYLLFSVLLWFVNFGRRLLEDSENINIGGF